MPLARLSLNIPRSMKVVHWTIGAGMVAALAWGIPVERQTPPQPSSKNVVVISVDGLRPELYLDPGAYGASLPTMRRLMKEGAYAEAVEGIYPSLTYPSHTSIATGVRPATHAILNNMLFDPVGGSANWYWYDEAIKVPALWDAAKIAGGSTGAVSWPVTVGAEIEYNLPEYWRNAPYSWRELLSDEMSPALLEAIETELGRIPDDPYEGARLETFTFDVASLILREFHPQLLLFHVFQTDGIQHQYGLEHVEVIKAFEEMDRKLHQFLKTLESSGLADNTLVVVTGDHGFIQVHSVVNINVAFQRAGLITLGAEGNVSDWKAMGWPSGGSCAIMLHDPGDVELRGKVDSVIAELLDGPLGSAIYRIPAEQLRRFGAMPEAAFALEGREGYIFGDGIGDNLIEPSDSLGYHGFLPDKPRMKTGFLMVGPGVRAGIRVPLMQLIDIAPTIAAWAGWEMPQAEGLALRGLFEKGIIDPSGASWSKREPLKPFELSR